VVRWRCADLKRVVRDRFGIDLSEVSLGRILQQVTRRRAARLSHRRHQQDRQRPSEQPDRRPAALGILPRKPSKTWPETVLTLPPTGGRGRQETLACDAVGRRGANRLDARGVPSRVSNSGTPPPTSDGVDFGALLLRPPIAYHDQPPNIRRRQGGGGPGGRIGGYGPDQRAGIEHEQDLSLPFLGVVSRRQDSQFDQSITQCNGDGMRSVVGGNVRSRFTDSGRDPYTAKKDCCSFSGRCSSMCPGDQHFPRIRHTRNGWKVQKSLQISLLLALQPVETGSHVTASTTMTLLACVTSFDMTRWLGDFASDKPGIRIVMHNPD